MNTEMQFLELGTNGTHFVKCVFQPCLVTPPWPCDWANDEILKCSTEQPISVFVLFIVRPYTA